MEVEGTRRLLRRTIESGLRVRSLTTDRSLSLNALVVELNREMGPITHYYDGWHLVKWLGNQLRKASKSRDCGRIAPWIQAVKTHLWYCIEAGSGRGETRHMFNTCLYHVRGVHQWAVAEEIGLYTTCAHGTLEEPHPSEMDEGSVAFETFRKVVLSRRFQQDLEKASPYGGTSICETKHALDRLYCRKEVFYPLTTYPLYAKMATMHMNTLRLADLSGERTLQRVVVTQRKHLTRPSAIKIMSPVRHPWRDEVFQELLSNRLNSLTMAPEEENPENSALPEEVLDAMEADEADAVSGSTSDSDSDVSELL